MGIRALVVGGTAGIGYAIASRIASEASSSVIISGRSKPSSLPHSNMEFRALDASSMRAIKQYTDQYKSAQEPKIDLLVMSQGILTMAGRTETPEGIDNKMALHFYGKQLLIRELAPVLKDDAKVLIVLDGTRGSSSKLNWDDLDLKNTFSLGRAADHCISMTDAMVQVHAAKLQPADPSSSHRYFFHAYPGVVSTGLFKNLPWYLKPLAKGAEAVLAVSPESCADHLVQGVTAASEKDARVWNSIDDKGRIVPNKEVWSEENLKKVEEHTWKIIDGALATK
ncbi:unnamed protein product [Clonostachys solani]|uniref:Uncharacterized protein n=1 Tax=Clonostachys solani TaxID=160281 RepID=A0A9P0E9C9_9HYPO|nr:unnamed protein product [Clonostachys solani]